MTIPTSQIPNPKPLQRFSEPEAQSAAENAVLSVVRHKHEYDEIRSFEQLAELAGLPVADAEKAARRLVARRCLKVVPIYEGVPNSPVEFKAVRFENPDVPPGTFLRELAEQRTTRLPIERGDRR